MIICYYRNYNSCFLMWWIFEVNNDIIEQNMYGYRSPTDDVSIKKFLYKISGDYCAWVSKKLFTLLDFKETANMNSIIDLLQKWDGKKWSELVEERRKLKILKESTENNKNNQKEINKILKSELKNIIIGISHKEYGIEFFDTGFRVTILCRSVGYNRRKTFNLIKSNQKEFVQWVRNSVANYHKFKRKGGTINAYKMSRFSVLDTPEIVCIFDIRKV